MRIPKFSSVDESTVIAQSKAKFSDSKMASASKSSTKTTKNPKGEKKLPWYKKLPLWGPVTALVLLLVVVSFFFQQSDLFQGRLSPISPDLLPAETTGESFEGISYLETASFNKMITNQMIDGTAGCDVSTLCLHSYSVSPQVITDIVVSVPKSGDSLFSAKLKSENVTLDHENAYVFAVDDRLVYVFEDANLIDYAEEIAGKQTVYLTLNQVTPNTNFDFNVELLSHPKGKVNNINLLKIDGNSRSFVGDTLEITAGEQNIFELDLSLNFPASDFETEEYVKITKSSSSLLSYNALSDGRFSITTDADVTGGGSLHINPKDAFSYASTKEITFNIIVEEPQQPESPLVLNFVPDTVHVGDTFTVEAMKNTIEVPASLDWELQGELAKIISKLDNTATLRALDTGTLVVTVSDHNDPTVSGVSSITIEPGIEENILTSIAITKSADEVTQGNTVELSIQPTPATASREVGWRLLTPELGQLSQEGIFVAGGVGVAEIQAISLVNHSITATALVNITADLSDINITSLEITPELPNAIYINDRIRFDYVATPSSAQGILTDLFWSTTDEDIASVVPKGPDAGYLTANALGSTNLVLSRQENGGLVEYDRMQIHVAAQDPDVPEPRVVNLTVSPTTLELVAGEAGIVDASIEVVNDADAGLTFEITNDNVASLETVGNRALITALEAGVTTLTAQSTFDTTKSAVVTITVTEAPSTVTDVRPPLISVTSPSYSNTDDYSFTGRVSDDSGVLKATFKLNSGTERVFVLDSQGKFLQALTLDQSETEDTVNVIKITAEDNHGNEAILYRTIVTAATNPTTDTPPQNQENPLAVTIDFDANPLTPELKTTVPLDKVIVNLYQDGRELPIYTAYFYCKTGEVNCPAYSNSTYTTRVRNLDITDVARNSLIDGQTYYYKAYIKQGNFERSDKSRRFMYRNEVAFPSDLAGRTCDYYFADLDASHPYCKEISVARELGILRGSLDEYGQNVFTPERPLVRAELFQIAGNIARLAPTTYVPANGPMFIDLEKYVNDPAANWFMSAILRMRLAGNAIVGGYDDGTVRPLQTITMAETVKVMLESGFSTGSLNTPRPEFDRTKSPWWSDYFTFAEQKGIAIPRDGLAQTLRMDVAYVLNEMYRADLFR